MRLSDYIKGLRKGKEAHRLEKESMKDPFLADALDGFQQVKGNHASTIEQLQKQVAARTSRQRRMLAWGWSVAACLLVGVGVGSYYLLFLQTDSTFKETKVLAESTPVMQAKDTLATRAEQDTVQVISPKRDKRSDVLAKAQVAPSANEKVMEMEEMQDEIQVTTSTANKAYVKLAQSADAKEKVVGKVVDENGDPVIGASVYYKGTNIGTITNMDGEFALEKNDRNKELTAQFVGCESVNMPIDTNRNILIVMNEDKAKLNEVVVVAYGAQQKSMLAGASKRAKTMSEDSIDTKSGKSVPVIGKKKFKKYLKENLIRPTDEACKDCKGKVTVTFFVDSNGNPQHIIVTKSLCESADKEAIRLIQEGPKWTIGQLPVKVEVQF